MRGSKFINWHPSIAMMLMFISTPSAAQDHENAMLKLQRQGYADALGENHPKVYGFDGRIELQNLGFRNPDLRTITTSDPTQSLIQIVKAMSKKIVILERRLAALENEVVLLRQAQPPIDPDDEAK